MEGDWVEHREKEYNWIILESSTFHELGYFFSFFFFLVLFRNFGTKKLHLLCLTYDRYFGSLFSYYAYVHCSTSWVGFFFFFFLFSFCVCALMCILVVEVRLNWCCTFSNFKFVCYFLSDASFSFSYIVLPRFFIGEHQQSSVHIFLPSRIYF